VVIAVTIDTKGNPIKYSVVEGEPLLAEATLKVFPRWHFVPITYKGEKVGASFEVRIRFTLIKPY
jgi:TonB family protein